LFLNGLGLDHRDFEKHLQSFKEFDCLSISVYGFQPTGNSFCMLSLDDHANLLCFVIKEIIKGNAYNSLILIGFSVGADLVLQIGANTSLPFKISKVIALDPNVNESTLTISKEIASIGVAKSPVEVAREISKNASVLQLDGWLDIHRYLVEIFSKFGVGRLSFLKNFARQVVEKYKGVSMDLFISLLIKCTEKVDECRIVFSDSTEHSLIHSKIKSKLNNKCFCRVAEGLGHFDLRNNLTVSKDEIDSV